MIIAGEKMGQFGVLNHRSYTLLANRSSAARLDTFPEWSNYSSPS